MGTEWLSCCELGSLLLLLLLPLLSLQTTVTHQLCPSPNAQAVRLAQACSVRGWTMPTLSDVVAKAASLAAHLCTAHNDWAPTSNVWQQF